MKNPLTKQERDWVLYDVANSAFILIVVTTFMPIFFKNYAASGLKESASTAIYANIVGTSALILALLSPVLGALADYRGMKKKFWGISIMLGIAFAVGLLFIKSGQWIAAGVLFVAARLFYTAANLFYDSFLPDITSPARMDDVSSKGFAWGYIGSVIPFVIALGVILAIGFGADGSVPPLGMKLAFAISLIWWGLFSLPMARGVKQNHGIEPSASAIPDAFRRVWKTIIDMRGNKAILLFLLAYFFYIDGVNTVITIAIAYGDDLGISQTMLIAVVLMIQIVAWPFAILFGKGAVRYGRKPMLFLGIIIYAIITFTAFMIPVIPGATAQLLTFWGIAFLVATSQGGVQALSRSYYAVLIPPEKSAEYFGFFNIFGRFAAILGPFLVSLSTTITGQSRYGVLSLSILFALGALFLALTPSPAVAKNPD